MAGNVGDSARLREPQGLSGEGSARSLFELAGLISGGTALAVMLWWLNGPPQIPSASPDWERIGQILTGSYLPYEDVIYVATGLGWLALGYLALTLALRAASQMLTRLTDGAAWTRAALRLSDIVTLPVVRRIMDGALAGTLFLAGLLRGGSESQVTASSEATAVAVAALPRPNLMHSVAGPDPCEPANQDVGDALSSDCFVSYTVVPGDNLWDISRRFYGDGTQYMVIFRANEGRVMTTGEAFTDPRLIRPRWALAVPLPGYNVWDAGARVMYRVRPDDSLWRISESLLGDGLRWTEIWELNEGREMGGGRRFTDPSLIRPDWVLELPIEVTLGSPRPIAEPTETAPSPTASPTVAPAATPEPEAEVAPHAEPTPVPVQHPGRDGGGAWDWSPPATTLVLATAAGLATVGGVALVVRQLVRRNGRAAFRPAGGQGRGKAPARGDVGRVGLAARALVRGLAELGFDDLRLMMARESERFLEFALECAPGDAEAVVRSRYDLGRRLACAVDGEVASSTRIRLKLSRFQRLAGLLVDEGTGEEPLLLVPVGAAENGVYYLNLAAAGTAIVVGSRHEAGKLLSAWLASLAAVYPPEHLAFLPAGGAASHLGDAASLPHFVMPAGESGERSVDELATELEETIVAREAASSGREQRAAIVGLAALSGECRAEIGRLETVLRRGPEHGISTVCVAEEENEAQLLGVFGARLVFGALAEGSTTLGAG
ncbi:MAG: LysM peptidoglycan-binding domain-containing protein, partial [Dehalococcoidia bacterium]|nr:LysM peptidoglycan-binding domain-containing protein [Dehalococcoidia bacterium]